MTRKATKLDSCIKNSHVGPVLSVTRSTTDDKGQVEVRQAIEVEA